MSKIDDLYNRAFGTRNYSYNDANWEKMESLLDDSLPITTSSSWLGKVASLALVGGLTVLGVLFNSPSKVAVPPSNALFSQAIAVDENENAAALAEKKSTSNPKLSIVRNDDLLANSDVLPIINSKEKILKGTQKTLIEDAASIKLILPNAVKHFAQNQVKLAHNKVAGDFENFLSQSNKEEDKIEMKEEVKTPENQIRTFTSLTFMNSPVLKADLEDINLKAFDYSKNKAKRFYGLM